MLGMWLFKNASEREASQINLTLEAGKMMI